MITELELYSCNMTSERSPYQKRRSRRINTGPLLLKKAPTEQRYEWAPLWRNTDQNPDGRARATLILFDAGQPLRFTTRRQCAAFIKERYGYIARRPDLRGPPHGWRMPIPVKVRITVEQVP